MNVRQGLLEDQDISSAGVRVTFYVQSFLTGELSCLVWSWTCIDAELLVLASVLPDSDITGAS